jgi:hypothetical protein
MQRKKRLRDWSVKEVAGESYRYWQRQLLHFRLDRMRRRLIWRKK